MRSDTPGDARWIEADPDLPSELSELLRAREPLGGAEEVAELARRLSAVLGPAAGLTGVEQPAPPDAGASPGPTDGAAAPSLRPPSAPALGAASRIRILGGIGAAVTIGVAAFVLLRGPSAPVGTPPPSAAPAPGSLAEAAPRATAEPASSVPASAVPPAASSTAPLAPPDGEVERGSGAAADRSAPAPAAPRRPSRAAALRQARSDGASETALLEQARAALQGRPAEALELTRRHQARFPHGVLAQEREVIAIEALERLGRKAAADARAAEFERRYRGSVHRSRLLRGSDTSVPAGGASGTPVP